MTANKTPKKKLEDEYRTKGYTLLPITGAGNSILIHPGQGKAVKLNELPHDKAFADFCQSNPDLALPRIYSHGARPGDLSVVEMEFLTKLDDNESEKLGTWYLDYCEAKAGNRPRPGDPFGIIDTVDALWDHMLKLQKQGVSIRALDIQPKNVMKDPNGCYKIIDGFD